MTSLDGKIAVVTGALGLLGRHHCRAFAAAGARVVASDLDEAACRAFAAELPRGAGIAMDLREEASVERFAERVEREVGPVDVLLNNAAINDMVEAPDAGGARGRFESYPVEMFRRSLEVNVTGMFLACQKIGTRMAQRGRGNIVNVASTYGMVAPDQSLYRKPDGTQDFFKSASYPTTKGAVLSFTRFLAAYWGGAGVRVNALSPGGVENGQDPQFLRAYAGRTPLGRMARAEEIARAALFLASDASSYMTGSNLVVDGGWTCW